MSDTLRLQLYVKKPVLACVKEKAIDMGFSSVQDLISLFLHKIAKEGVSFDLGFGDERLSPRAEKRLMRIDKQLEKDIASGKAKTYTSVDEMMKDLMA